VRSGRVRRRPVEIKIVNSINGLWIFHEPDRALPGNGHTKPRRPEGLAIRGVGPNRSGALRRLTRRARQGGIRGRRCMGHGRRRSLGVFTQTEEDTAQYQDKCAEHSDAKPIGSIAVNVVGAQHRGLPTNGSSQRHKPFRRRCVPLPGGISAPPGQVSMVDAPERACDKVSVTSTPWPSDHAFVHYSRWRW